MKITKRRVKGLISSILVLTFVLVGISGVLLFFLQGGLVLGIPRRIFIDTHNIAGLVLAAAVLPHFLFNWKQYKNELRIKKKN